MKKFTTIAMAATLSTLYAGAAAASNVNVNDGDAVVIASSQAGVFGNMRFVAKVIAPNSSVDIPINEAHVDLYFRPQSCRAIASYTGNVDQSMNSVVWTTTLNNSTVTVRKLSGILRIENKGSNTIQVTGYYLAI